MSLQEAESKAVDEKWKVNRQEVKKYLICLIDFNYVKLRTEKKEVSKVIV